MTQFSDRYFIKRFQKTQKEEYSLCGRVLDFSFPETIADVLDKIFSWPFHLIAKTFAFLSVKFNFPFFYRIYLFFEYDISSLVSNILMTCCGLKNAYSRRNEKIMSTIFGENYKKVYTKNAKPSGKKYNSVSEMIKVSKNEK